MTDTTETARQYCLGDLAIWLRRLGKQEADAMVQDSFRECADDCERAAEELARLREEHAKLLGFVRSLVKYFQTGVTAWSLLDLASAHEIISAEAMSSPCREDCKCRKAGVFPTLCYRLAEFVRAQ